MKPGDRVSYYTGRGGLGTIVAVYESEGFAVVKWDDGRGPPHSYLNALRAA